MLRRAASVCCRDLLCVPRHLSGHEAPDAPHVDEPEPSATRSLAYEWTSPGMCSVLHEGVVPRVLVLMQGCVILHTPASVRAPQSGTVSSDSRPGGRGLSVSTNGSTAYNFF